MADVFVSYSRRDTDFVRRLADALRDGGRDVWVDTEGIADAEHFPDALRAAIEGADGFVFVITPAAATSRYCLQEVEHAQAMGKRIVPVLREPVPDDQLHPEVRDRNWVPFTDDGAFATGMERLDRALSTDLAHAKAHTRWLTRAVEWDAAGRNASLLPRGDDLAAAEGWLAAAGVQAEPQPTQLQRDYLLAGRRAATRRQRRTVAISTAVTVVSLVLLVVAILAQRSASHGRAVARHSRTLARAEALAARSDAARSVSPLAAVHLATEALETSATPAGQRAAKQALDANPLLAVAGPLPLLKDQSPCGAESLSFRPGGTQLAATLCDGSVRIMDGSTGRTLERLRPGPDPISAAYSPDGRDLAVLIRKAVVILDAQTDTPRRTIRLPGARLEGGAQVGSTTVKWSPEGDRLAAVWGTRAYLLRRTGGARVVLGGQSQWGDVAFVGDELAVGTINDTIEVYDARTAAHLRTVPVSDGPRYAFGPALAATPDGKRVVVGRYTAADEGRVEVYDARTWRREAIVSRIPLADPASLAISPDGTRIAFAATSDHAEVVSLRSGHTLLRVPTTDYAAGLAFSPDSRRLALSGGASAATLDIVRAQGAERRYLEGRPERTDTIAATPTQLRAVDDPSAGGVRVESWRRADGHRLPDIVISRTGNRLVAFSHDGRYLVETRSAVRDRPRVWDLDRRRIVRRLPAVRAGGMSVGAGGQIVFPEGNYYSGGTKGPLVLENLAGGPRRETAPPGRDLCAGYQDTQVSGDGRLVAGASYCGDVLLWDGRSGRRTGTIKVDGAIQQLAITHGGGELAIVRADNQVEIWATHPQRRLRVLRGAASGGSYTPGFTPDGRRLVAVSLDGSIRVWDVASGRLLRELSLPGIQMGLAYAGNATLLLSDNKGAVRELDVCADCERTSALLARLRRAGACR